VIVTLWADLYIKRKRRIIHGKKEGRKKEGHKKEGRQKENPKKKFHEGLRI
jgi:hypothetical protein